MGAPQWPGRLKLSRWARISPLISKSQVEFAIAGAILGVLLICTQGGALLRSLRAQDWKQVEGLIVSSEAVRDPYAGDRHIFWSPVITYEYEVQGTRYTARRISLTGHGVRNSQNGAIRQATTDFAPGARVAVWYDPQDPRRAALIRQTGLASWLLFGMGVVFLWLTLPVIIAEFSN